MTLSVETINHKVAPTKPDNTDDQRIGGNVISLASYLKDVKNLPYEVIAERMARIEENREELLLLAVNGVKLTSEGIEKAKELIGPARVMQELQTYLANSSMSSTGGSIGEILGYDAYNVQSGLQIRILLEQGKRQVWRSVPELINNDPQNNNLRKKLSEPTISLFGKIAQLHGEMNETSPDVIAAAYSGYREPSEDVKRKETLVDLGFSNFFASNICANPENDPPEPPFIQP